MKREAQKKPHEEESKESAIEFQIPAAKLRDFLASGSRDKTVKIWEVKSGRCIASL
mgnify:CR=1 FL=1|jgi:WD40 repeat protein